MGFLTNLIAMIVILAFALLSAAMYLDVLALKAEIKHKLEQIDRPPKPTKKEKKTDDTQ